MQRGLGILLIALTVSGCNPVPMPLECVNARFTETSTVKAVKYFPTWGVLSSFCEEKIPQEVKIVLDNGMELYVRTRQEWLDLRATQDGKKYYGFPENIRRIPLDGYSNMVRMDSFQDNKMSFVFQNGVQVNVPYRVHSCTCVTYDAL